MMKHFRFLGVALAAILLLAGSITINRDSSAMLADRGRMAAAGGGVVTGGNDEYTVLLLHMDGVDDAQVFTDSSVGGVGSPHTVDAGNDVKTEDTAWRFEPTSAYFDGAGDYLTIADSVDWDFGSGDFTIDCWVNGSEITTENYIIEFKNSVNLAGRILIEAGEIKAQFINDDASQIIAITSSGVSLNTWTHVAVVRTASALRVFLDGVLDATDAGADNGKTIKTSTQALIVGNGELLTVTCWTGHIDELRISKGVDRTQDAGDLMYNGGTPGDPFDVPTKAYF